MTLVARAVAPAPFDATPDGPTCAAELATRQPRSGSLPRDQIDQYCEVRLAATSLRGTPTRSPQTSRREGRNEGILDTHTRYASPARPADDQQYLDSSTHHRRAECKKDGARASEIIQVIMISCLCLNRLDSSNERLAVQGRERLAHLHAIQARFRAGWQPPTPPGVFWRSWARVIRGRLPATPRSSTTARRPRTRVRGQAAVGGAEPWPPRCTPASCGGCVRAAAGL